MAANKLIAAGLAILVLSLFIAVSPHIPQLSERTTDGSSFQLDLEIALKSYGNITDYAFYVVSDGIQESSAVINVPANVSIEIKIINRDPGIDSLMKQSDSNLTGADSGLMSIAPLLSPQEYSYEDHIAGGNVSHTFTTSNGLNVPVPPLSTVTFNATFTGPGTYSWGCMCQCGEYSMNTAGWMYGVFLVS